MLKAHGSCSIPLMLIPLSSDGNQTSTAHREMVIFQGSNNLVFLHMYIVYIVLSWEDQPFTSFSLRKIIVFVQIVNCIVLIVCWFSVFFWNYAAIVFIWDSLSVSVHCPWYLAKLKIVFDQIQQIVLCQCFWNAATVFCLTVSLCLCPYSSPLTWNISQLVKQKHAFSRLFTGIYISPERHAKPIQKVPSIWHLSGGPKASFSDICKNIQNKIKHLAFPHVGLVEPGTGCPKQVSLLRHICK